MKRITGRMAAVGLALCLFAQPLMAEEACDAENECCGAEACCSETECCAATKNVHHFTMTDIQGEEVKLASFKDNVLLIVNVASKCGLTPQYEDLVKLQKEFGEKGLAVIAFPANNFGQQEPGTDEEILEFCSTNYQVNFPLFSKISVKGEDQHPLFKMLTAKENPDFTGEINWNFEKFLVGKDGELLRRFRSRTAPMGEEITKAIEEALKADIDA